MEVNPLNVFPIRNMDNILWIGNPTNHSEGYIEFKVKDLQLSISAISRVISEGLVNSEGSRELLVYCAKTKKHYILMYSGYVEDIEYIGFYYRTLKHKRIEITKIYLI